MMHPKTMALAAALFVAAAQTALPAQAAACSSNLSRGIPARAATSPTGSEFLSRIQGLDDDQREAAILGELESGNIPSFLRRLSPVVLIPADRRTDSETIICVAPDYLAIGSDQDYFLVPMRLETALTVARRFGFVLPTRRMVDAVYAQAQVQLSPQPLPAGDTMRSTAYYWQHNRMVRDQRSAFGAPLGALTAGDKKDLVLTTRLWTMQDRVAIYGWHRPEGTAIQPLSTVHGWHYADYSHGVRLVADTMFVEGKPQSLLRALGDADQAGPLSDEGAIPRLSFLIDRLERQFLHSGA
jgi:hypothetical protein